MGTMYNVLTGTGRYESRRPRSALVLGVGRGLGFISLLNLDVRLFADPALCSLLQFSPVQSVDAETLIIDSPQLLTDATPYM